MKVWDLHRYEEMRIIEARLDDGQPRPILGAAFSPNGQQIVTACRDRTARLWDRSGRFILEFQQGHQYLASTAVFYPDQRRLLTAAMDGTARVWDLATERPVAGPQQNRRQRRRGLVAQRQMDAHGRRQRSGRRDGRRPGPASRPAWRKAKRSLGRQALGCRQPANLLRTFAGPSRRGHGRGLLGRRSAPLQRRCQRSRAALRTSRVIARSAPLQKIHVRGITAAVFLPHGGGLLTASGDNTVAQWDIVSGPEGYVARAAAGPAASRRRDVDGGLVRRRLRGHHRAPTRS